MSHCPLFSGKPKNEAPPPSDRKEDKEDEFEQDDELKRVKRSLDSMNLLEPSNDLLKPAEPSDHLSEPVEPRRPHPRRPHQSEPVEPRRDHHDDRLFDYEYEQHELERKDLDI